MEAILAELRAAFRGLRDRADPWPVADVTGWWRSPVVLAGLGGALAGLHEAVRPTVVVGPQSRGALIGALTAVHLGVGLVEIRKDPDPAAFSDPWWEVTTRPDYRDRHLRLGARRDLLRSGDRVLFVDEWVDTGGQLEACHRLVAMSGASWLGAAVIVDALPDPGLRRRLGLRSLLRSRDLPWNADRR